MPGLFGLIGKLRKEEGTRRLQQMLVAMSYEPFYLRGIHIDESLGLYLGWTAHPSSFCDRLPARSRDGRITLVFAGEAFDATRDGEPFEAAHLIDRYAALGERFYADLNGTFSGVLADSNARRVKLFTDRLGYEKIYYCRDIDTDTFYFASEAKALLRVLPETREFDREGLAQFLRFGATFDERTLYKGVSRLPPASVWEFPPADSSPRKWTYFSSKDWETDPNLTPHQLQQDFLDIFCKILPPYAQGKAESALSLTGGWDTRMILAARKFEPGTLPCYTFAGFSGETIDVRQARKVALSLGQEYSVVRLQDDFLTEFADHAEKTTYVSDGYAGVGLTHEIYLNRSARRISQLRLTGNFGSEILRGVSTFKEVSLDTEWYQGELAGEFSRSREELNVGPNGDSSARFAIFKEIPWKLATSLRLANSQLQIRTPYLDNELLRLTCKCPPNISGSFRPSALVQSLRPALLEIPTDRGESGKQKSGLSETLRRVWFQGTFKLDYMATEGVPHFLAYPVDHWRVNRFLPVRHKYLDYRQWFRGPLRGYVEDMLGGPNTFVRGLAGRRVVDRILKDHRSGTRNTLSDLGALMNLELINKCLFLQGQESEGGLTSLLSENNLVERGLSVDGN